MTLEQGFRNFARRAKHRGSEIDRRVTLYAYRAVKRFSPVDTGIFRASWNVSIGSPDTTVATEGYPGAAGDDVSGAEMSQAETALLPLQWGDETYLANGTHYGEALEGGHSPFAPTGVLFPTIQATRVALGGIISGVVRGG